MNFLRRVASFRDHAYLLEDASKTAESLLKSGSLVNKKDTSEVVELVNSLVSLYHVPDPPLASVTPRLSLSSSSVKSGMCKQLTIILLKYSYLFNRRTVYSKQN